MPHHWKRTLKRLQFGLHTWAQRIAVQVKRHGDQAVPAAQAHHIDDTFFPIFVFRGLERGICHLVRGQQFVDEVVSDFHIGRHTVGTLPIGDGVHDFRLHAVLQRGRLMRVPFVLCHPIPSSHDDDRFGNVFWNACTKTHRAAELLSKITHFGTAEQNIERSAHAPALSCQKMVDHRLLLRRHFVVFERLEAVSDEDQASRVGRLFRVGRG